MTSESPDLDELRKQHIAYFGNDPFRPRDEFDVDVHPESLRGKALRLMDEVVRVEAEMDAAIAALPWYRRWPIRVTLAAIRLRYRLPLP